MSRKLVAWFSASGVTAGIAAKLAGLSGADVYEIKPEIPYTEADLDWKNEQSRSSIETHNPESRPAITDDDAKIQEYDVIFIGFPIWWGIAPTIIRTFLEKYDFSGKEIILFATSGGSGFGETADGLKLSVSDTAVIRTGAVFKGSETEDELQTWLNSLN